MLRKMILPIFNFENGKISLLLYIQHATANLIAPAHGSNFNTTYQKYIYIHLIIHLII